MEIMKFSAQFVLPRLFKALEFTIILRRGCLFVRPYDIHYDGIE